MTKIDIFSGFLGAGKTTLIKKLIKEAYAGEKLVLIENEFGEISVDGGFLQDAGVQINEMSSGCICCSLVGDFTEALRKVTEQFDPDRILIEPSGVGKLSDVICAVQSVSGAGLQPGSFTTVVDATRARLYMKNFGEFWCNQVENASCVVLSRTSGLSAEKLAAVVALLREKNPDAVIVTTPWDQLDGKTLRAAMEKTDTLQAELKKLAAETRDEDEDEDDDHDHEREHEHGGTCACGHDHGHHHHHGHDADEVFMSWGTETPRIFAETEIKSALAALDTGKYGQILRAKGYVQTADGWLHFDYVPGEAEVRRGPAGITGRLCVIGAELDAHDLKELFKVD